MPHRSPARYLAPLALVLAFLAVFSTIQSTNENDAEPAVTQAPAETTTTTTQEKSDDEDEEEEEPTTYTVESGDVLSAIAEETGVSLQRLLELNPDLDPQSLRTGQEIKLSP